MLHLGIRLHSYIIRNGIAFIIASINHSISSIFSTSTTSAYFSCLTDTTVIDLLFFVLVSISSLVKKIYTLILTKSEELFKIF